MAFIGNTPISVAFLTDTFSGNGSTTAFTMTVAPANTSSIIVAITGVLQDPSTYSVSGTTLTFSAAPPTGTSNISVRYLGIPASGVTTTAYRTVTNFTATAGQTSFSVPSYTIGYIDVYRNGVRLVSTDFTATTGTTVVLNNGCTVGDAVVTESFYVSSVLNAIPATAGAVNSTYIADNAITTAKITAGAVTQAKLGTGVAGNGPAFSAYLGSNQTPSNATYTKVQINTESFDTASCFDTSTYRFTPNVAGYYQIQAACRISGTTPSTYVWAIYKNGGNVAELNVATSPASFDNRVVSSLISMNGTTDYLEFYCYINAASGQTFNSGSNVTWFQGFLARAA
jgi:hypothetical protein